MNDRKFCFIICSNHHFLVEECQKYIRQLEVPEGYETEIIVIYDAKSMTSGYYRAMKKSSAKYKIYLHQDVLLINRRMLYEILDIFQANSHVGMIGMVGNPVLAEDGCPWSGEKEQRIGEIYADLIDHKVYSLFRKVKAPYQKVLTIDGLLMATQYDIPWRDDIFEGWDFYDGSQSMEFWKAGYSVVVPYMERPWCLHDNDILHLQDYETWRRVFETEYRRYYQGRHADELVEGEKLQKSTPVIYQIFDPQKTRFSYPYPPVYRDSEAQYLCFTDQKNVKSGFWKIRYCEELSEDVVCKELSGFSMKREIKTDEIQTAPAFCTNPFLDTVVQIPPLESLPDISVNLEKFVPTRDENGRYIYQKNPVFHGGKYDGRELLLTIGMPVSNQIGTIERCLSHIRPLLEGLDAELLVVDTGSTDGTLDVCRKYGARVIKFPWCNDMSAARNQGIYHAKGEWYMSIDDDEWFEDVSEILWFFQSGEYKKYNIAAYIQRNYFYCDEQVYTDSFALRMAKITPELHFEGRIHDALDFPDRSTGYQFHAYVHHYGFVTDNEARRKEKYVRNVSGLLYDLWEMPQDLRFVQQLCKEFLAVGYYGYAYAYGFLGISVEQEIGSQFYGHMIASSLMSAFYYAEDERVFEVKKLIEGRYSYTDAENAYFSYVLADIGTRKQYDPEEILKNVRDYRKYRAAYLQNKDENQRFADVGINICSNPQYETDAQFMEFYAYQRMGNLTRALKVLDGIDPEYIWYKKLPYLECMLTGEEAVYQAILNKMPAVQMELWIADIMDIFQRMRNLKAAVTAVRRIFEIVDHVSIQALQVYLNTKKIAVLPELEKMLVDHLADEGEDNLSVQQCYIYAMFVKYQMIETQDEREHMQLFAYYRKMMCSFAKKYYHPDLLSVSDSPVISPEVRALCEIGNAVCEQNDRETVRHLKKALEIFPGVKKEIRFLLNNLQQEKKTHSVQKEMELLRQQLENQIQILMEQGRIKEAEQILRELEQIFPGRDM